MNTSVYRLRLDVHKPNSGVCLEVKRGDANSRQLLILLSENGVPYRISEDCYAVFAAEKPDGNKVFNDCVIEGDRISYTLTPQTVAVEGRMKCEIRLYGADDMLITSPGFDIIVRGTVYNEGDEIESATEVEALTHLISEATTAIRNVNSCKITPVEQEDGVLLKIYNESLAGGVSSTPVFIKHGKDGAVQTINGIAPDENGNVEIETSAATEIKSILTDIVTFLKSVPFDDTVVSASDLDDIQEKIDALASSGDDTGDDTGGGDDTGSGDDTGGDTTETVTATFADGVLAISGVTVNSATFSNGVLAVI